MLDRSWARAFAEEWIECWNSHDLERILSHYADDFTMISPLIVDRMKEPGGTLKGKDRIRPYWQMGLAASPPLRFKLVDVLVGVNSIAIHYRSLKRKMVVEVLVFDESGKVIRGMAHHGRNAED